MDAGNCETAGAVGGDLNIPAENYLMAYYGSDNQFHVTAAKACHHGSSDFTVNYLKKVKPYVKAIPSGDNKSFDHPTADAIGAAAQWTRGALPLLFSTELGGANSSSGVHYGLINLRNNGNDLVAAQMKEHTTRRMFGIRLRCPGRASSRIQCKC